MQNIAAAERVAGDRSLLIAGAVLAVSAVAFFRVPLLPEIGASLAIRPAVLSLVTVVFGLGRLATDVPAGRLADRVAAPLALSGAGAVMAFGSFLIAGAGSLWMLLAAAAVLGVASAVANTTGMTFFSHAPAARRGTSMAIYSAALLGGQSLGPAVSGLVSGLMGWRTAEVLGGVVVIGVAATCAALGAAGRRGAIALTSAVPRHTSLPRQQRVLLYAVPFSVMFMLGAMPQTIVPLLGAHDYGLSVGAIGLTLGLGGLFRFIGSALGGIAADRYSRKGSLVPGLALMSGGVALLAVHGGTAVFVTAVCFMSLGSYGVTVAATMLADLGGKGIGRRLGTFRFVGDLGLVAGPLAAGTVYDLVGARASVLLVAGVVAACSISSGLFLPETKHMEGDGALAPVE
jgi:MFS transporter, DHA1 family, multidrug resistance protein